MTEHSPITPPPELVQQWIAEIWHEGTPIQVAQSDLHLAARSAQWGADQELEACRMEILAGKGVFHIEETSDRVCLADDLCAARRPKPPSLKEQALKTLEEAPGPDYPMAMTLLNAEEHALIRRALKELPE
jgi:hypothetical protein